MVEFDRGTGSPVHRRLVDLALSGAGLAVTQPVVAEIVAGARTDRHERDLRRALGRAALLPFDAAQDFDIGAGILRRCRRVGVPPRGLLDCMIAAVALRTGAALLCQDVDLVRIAQVVGVELDGATPRPS